MCCPSWRSLLTVRILSLVSSLTRSQLIIWRRNRSRGLGRTLFPTMTMRGNGFWAFSVIWCHSVWLTIRRKELPIGARLVFVFRTKRFIEPLGKSSKGTRNGDQKRLSRGPRSSLIRLSSVGLDPSSETSLPIWARVIPSAGLPYRRRVALNFAPRWASYVEETIGCQTLDQRCRNIPESIVAASSKSRLRPAM